MIIKNIDDINIILPLHFQIFGKEFPIQSYYKKIKNFELLIYVYEYENQLIGYSIIIDQKKDKNLYAWYGGIIPKFQGNRITKQFFDKLTLIAEEKSYLSITVATSNLRPHMLKFAIDYGFDIYDIKKRNTGEGNKIYFKYKILPPQQKEIFLIKNGVYLNPVDIELELVKAYKNNCNTFIFKEIQNKITFVYALKYCNKFLKKPKLIIYNNNNNLSSDINLLLKNYNGNIEIKNIDYI